MKKTKRFVISIASLLILINFSIYSAAAANLYKWVDKYGRVTYQSTPPPSNAASVEKSKITTGTDNAHNAEDINEHPEDAIDGLKPIKFYIKEECERCDEARGYLEENSVPYEEINLTENTDEAAELEKKLGVLNAPIFAIGEAYVSGFQNEMLNKLLSSQGYQLPAENLE